MIFALLLLRVVVVHSEVEKIPEAPAREKKRVSPIWLSLVIGYWLNGSHTRDDVVRGALHGPGRGHQPRVGPRISSPPSAPPPPPRMALWVVIHQNRFLNCSLLIRFEMWPFSPPIGRAKGSAGICGSDLGAITTGPVTTRGGPLWQQTVPLPPCVVGQIHASRPRVANGDGGGGGGQMGPIGQQLGKGPTTKGGKKLIFSQ